MGHTHLCLWRVLWFSFVLTVYLISEDAKEEMACSYILSQCIVMNVSLELNFLTPWLCADLFQSIFIYTH